MLANILRLLPQLLLAATIRSHSIGYCADFGLLSEFRCQMSLQ